MVDRALILLGLLVFGGGGALVGPDRGLGALVGLVAYAATVILIVRVVSAHHCALIYREAGRAGLANVRISKAVVNVPRPIGLPWWQNRTTYTVEGTADGADRSVLVVVAGALFCTLGVTVRFLWDDAD